MSDNTEEKAGTELQKPFTPPERTAKEKAEGEIKEAELSGIAGGVSGLRPICQDAASPIAVDVDYIANTHGASSILPIKR